MARKIPLRDFGSLRVKTPLAFAGQRIGIMGGTFNPPHAGHALVAETAVKRLAARSVVVGGDARQSAQDRTAGYRRSLERMAAARRLARGPRMKITGFEQMLGTPYTAATLAFLKRRYPGVRFVWVMGADNLASFDRWQHWQSIAATLPIAVVDRPGWRLKSLAGRAGSTLAPIAHPGGFGGEPTGPQSRRPGLS